MARINIWDMDFYYKKSFLPNPTLMKISSFHKQQEDLVNFITEEFHINLPCDIYYIMRDKKETPRAPSKITDSNKTRLLGKGFKFFPNYYEPSAVIAAVRPDYLLYPEQEKNAYYNANIAQFYHNGNLLKIKQPFQNTKSHHKKTLVIDKIFWDSTDENIKSCLLELREYKNIAFLYPIKLKKLIKNKEIFDLFLKLDFSKGTLFKFQNNYGSSFEEALDLFELYKELKEKHEHVDFGKIPFKTVTTEHWGNQTNGLYDLERCLKIINESKFHKIKINLVAPDRRKFETPFWYYFEILEVWTTYFPEYSYIELMLHSAIKRFKMPWYAILNNSSFWQLPNTHFLLKLMINKKEFIELYGYRQWGDKLLERELINWNIIEKYRGIIKNENEYMEETHE
jgi:hypothetical protein